MKRHYVVYDLKTGAILRHGFCADPSDVARQARGGEAVIALSAAPPPGAKIDLTKSPPALAAPAAS